VGVSLNKPLVGCSCISTVSILWRSVGHDFQLYCILELKTILTKVCPLLLVNLYANQWSFMAVCCISFIDSAQAKKIDMHWKETIDCVDASLSREGRATKECPPQGHGSTTSADSSPTLTGSLHIA